MFCGCDLAHQYRALLVSDGDVTKDATFYKHEKKTVLVKNNGSFFLEQSAHVVTNFHSTTIMQDSMMQDTFLKFYIQTPTSTQVCFLSVHVRSNHIISNNGAKPNCDWCLNF